MLFGLLSAFALDGFAQVGEYRSNLAFGVNAGATFNKVEFNPSVKQVMKQGSTFGLTLRYTCEKYIKAICAIQMEVNYAQLGWKEDIDPITLEGGATRIDKYERTMNYVQVPLLARMGWGREKRGMQFFILAGPQFGMFLSESEKANFNFSEEGLADKRPSGVTSQYGKTVDNKVEYGITAGMGVELSTKVGHFLLEGRYYYGLGDFYANSKKDPFERSAHGMAVAKMSYLIDLTK
ncbi:MAG: PorT family protein [Bacteroidaceae bacterium]|nr:PorT family protein [Bacteroidaceae bacterium]